MIYLELFFAFLNVGFFSFGGAYGALPLIRDVMLSHGWLDDEMLMTMLAVSESTPGPIMINLATYVGSTQAGLPGAAVATLAVVLPSFFIILLILLLLSTVWQNPYLQAVLRGFKPCLTGCILATGIGMLLHSCLGSAAAPTVHGTELIMTAFLATIYFGSRKIYKKLLSPIRLIIISALLGIIVFG